MNSQQTREPGPWQDEVNALLLATRAAARHDARYIKTYSWLAANARLIAEAPAMREELQAVEDCLSTLTGYHVVTRLIHLRALLARIDAEVR